jgi:hypothetical protein
MAAVVANLRLSAAQINPIDRRQLRLAPGPGRSRLLPRPLE